MLVLSCLLRCSYGTKCVLMLRTCVVRAVCQSLMCVCVYSKCLIVLCDVYIVLSYDSFVYHIVYTVYVHVV